MNPNDMWDPELEALALVIFGAIHRNEIGTDPADVRAEWHVIGHKEQANYIAGAVAACAHALEVQR
ncbi:hypothetical protein [Nocardia xishanensis]|uniref:hypothetical protein n=1 Tax=Nocardia xishanensis TaxID=238964 RepID=UPI00083017BD|nr:hypothetical protein [Nocardia xishanensis]